MSSKRPKRRKGNDGMGRNDQIGENGGNDQIGGNDTIDEIVQIDRNENEKDDNVNENEATAIRSQLKNTESKWQHLDQEQSAWASMTSDSG